MQKPEALERNLQNLSGRLKAGHEPSSIINIECLEAETLPHKITAGLACGAAVSFTPFLGTHFAQAMLLSWLIRANAMAGFIGTAWGNPWTFPFLFWIDYIVGINISNFFGWQELVALPEGMDFAYFVDKPGLFMNYLFANPVKLLLPLSIGGVVCGALFWPIAYASLYYPVDWLRAAYNRERSKRFKRGGK